MTSLANAQRRWQKLKHWSLAATTVASLLVSCGDGEEPKPCLFELADSWNCTDDVIAVCCESHCGSTSLSEQCEVCLGLSASYVYTSCDGEPDCDGDGTPNDRDCEDCDAERHRQAMGYVDADADGHPEQSESLCVGDEFADGYVEEVAFPDSTDCDDRQADRWQLACRDGDGDDWCVGATECVGELPVGYRLGEVGWLQEDCDDTDPSRQRPAYGDEDSDGERADYYHPSACVAASEPLPFNWSFSYGTDCDDHDFNVVPEQADLVGDGLDANCDGTDGAQGIECGDACACWPNAVCDITTTCADRPDIAILDVIAGTIECQRATPGVLAVVNQGGVAFSGTVMLTESDFYGGNLRAAYCWYDTTFPIELAPGQTQIFEIDPLCLQPSLVILEGDDCLADNNTTRFRTEISSCST